MMHKSLCKSKALSALTNVKCTLQSLMDANYDTQYQQRQIKPSKTSFLRISWRILEINFCVVWV